MRPSQAETYMGMVDLLAKRSTCLRRSVGCILTTRDHKIISTGYNGVAVGMKHCNTEIEETQIHPSGSRETFLVYPHACEGATLPSGQGLDKCEAIHAEQNALLQCQDTDKIFYCYVSCSPCIHCIKLLMNTGCHAIYCREIYDQRAKELWENSGIGRGLYLI